MARRSCCRCRRTCTGRSLNQSLGAGISLELYHSQEPPQPIVLSHGADYSPGGPDWRIGRGEVVNIVIVVKTLWTVFGEGDFKDVAIRETMVMLMTTFIRSHLLQGLAHVQVGIGTVWHCHTAVEFRVPPRLRMRRFVWRGGNC